MSWMAAKVFGIGGSPRRGGNTDILLREVLRGASAAGANVECVFLRDMNLSPCRECYACERDGVCVIKDDMHMLYAKFLSADCIVLASPIFFYGVTAQTKMMIDRCQCLWVRKYLRKEPMGDPGRLRRGVFVSVGATRGEKLFEGAILTVKYLFDALDFRYFGELLVRGVDEKGAILDRTEEMEKAFLLGKDLLREDVGG
ncbi:MAG: flavodoxin family protein [bacterium]